MEPHQRFKLISTTFCTNILNIFQNEKKTLETHPIGVSKIAKTGLQLDADKCVFYVKKTIYLNLIIIPENIKMDQEKISSIFDWPKFENFKNV